MSHPVLNHWHTSEINFGDIKTAEACVAALNNRAGHTIIVHANDAVVLLEGYFDFANFEDEFEDIIFSFIAQPCEFSLKAIFNDADGYFGGWFTTCNNSGDPVKSVSLNDMFEGL